MNPKDHFFMTSRSPLLANLRFWLPWFVLVTTAAVLSLWGLSRQGFWETPAVPAAEELPSQVPRQRPVAEPSEFTRFLALEEASSASWPPLVQWSYRGAARLGSPVELTTRLPSLLSMALLLSLVIGFLCRYAGPREAWWGALALITMPLVLLGARTLSLEGPLILLHGATVLCLYVAFFGASLPGSVRLWAVFAAAAALLGVLAGGWVWGAVAGPVSFALGVLFARRSLRPSRRQVWIVAGLVAAGAAIAGALMSGLIPGTPAWLFPEANPASAVPGPKAPHAVFTTFIARVAFGTFPWSVIVLVGLFATPGSAEEAPGPAEGAPAPFLDNFFAGWLLATLLLGAYHEMRVGPAPFTGLVPLAGLGALAITRIRGAWFTPAVAALLGLFSLLIFRDLAMYPQLLPELATGLEIPSVRLRLGPWILPLGLALVVPLVVLGRRRLAGFGAGFGAFWRDLRAQSLLFYILSWPLDLLARGLGWTWRRRPGKGRIKALCESLVHRIPSPSGWLPGVAAAVFLSFGGWFSLHVIPELTRELSSRAVFAGVARHGAPGDALAVYEGSPRPAPVYAGRPAAVLGTDADLAAFMRGASPEGADGGRRFLVFPARLLGKVDYLSRVGGWRYHVLGTDSLTWRLAATGLPPGVADANPLSRFVSTAAPPFSNAISSQLEDALELVGYDVPRVAARGQTITVRLVFRVKRPLPADHKVFIHLDPPYGTRITADHEPVQGLLPTRYFAPGTYVVDEYAFGIPKVGFPVGRYGVYAGLFSGNNRVNVTGGAHAGQDRIPLGSLEITRARGWFGCGGAAPR